MIKHHGGRAFVVLRSEKDHFVYINAVVINAVVISDAIA